MEVIITIFKDQLESNPELKPQLAKLCLEVIEISTAFLYLPQEDCLVKFVSLLNEHRISFGAHIPAEEILELIRLKGSGRTGSKV